MFMITGINVVRNCIDNGYPFIESILSAYPLCGEYLVNDGGSTDGTSEALRRLSETYPRIKVFNIADEANLRWDSVSNQINHMIKRACGTTIFLGNADELIHEADVPRIREEVLTTDKRVLRLIRKEVTSDWSALSEDSYPPARIAVNTNNVRQDWSNYGGDEFLYDDEWVDPHRKNIIPIILYHLFNLFPGNKVNKLRNDAEHLAPGDPHRVKLYENYKSYKGSPFYPPKNIYPNLPALARGLPYMESYVVRECLYDVEWVQKITGLDFLA